MVPKSSPRFLSAAVAVLGIAAPASAQVYFEDGAAHIPQGAPFNNSSTENVDFADVDGDGDWDAAFADGADTSLDQNRIWINLGHAQGGIVGDFADATTARCPAINDQSRDIEFVDFDQDGDPDVYVSNTATIANQSNRWWTNSGGTQGGSAGFYVDETASRWVGLGGPGSSVPSSAVLASGGFIDWSCDCDFGDLDDDGDLDLVHSSYGSQFGGLTPSRLFLNDGTGGFAEFNPSGAQLASVDIHDGDPALWSQGVQLAGTTNFTGAQSDIAEAALDVEVGDLDGDFDLDLLLGSKPGDPRIFRNRSAETGTFAFRDVTAAVLPADAAIGNGHYAQEIGDLDGDGDLDLYGISWHGPMTSLIDVTLRNTGNGVFDQVTEMAGSDGDKNEADFVDYDGDGDLDVFTAGTGVSDAVYRNTIDGGTSFAFVRESGALTFHGGIGLDADACDVDEDGDYDVMSARDVGLPDVLHRNVLGAADTFGPRIPRTSQPPDRAPSAAPTVVHAQVYDNAAYYIVWYHATRLEYRVDGGAPQTVAMRSSAGQVFRGEIPGALSGLVTYRVLSTDEHQNGGASAVRGYVAGATGAGFCFGDGSVTACPCGNASAIGSDSGCVNSLGVGARLVASGAASVANDALSLAAHGMPNSSALFFQGTAQQSGGAGATFGDGLRCASGTIVRLGTKTASGGVARYPAAGDAPVSVRGGVPAGGGSRHYQVWYRNAAAFCSASTFNLTNGWTVSWIP